MTRGRSTHASSTSPCRSPPTAGSKAPPGSPIRRRQSTRASGATGWCSPRSRRSCSPSPSSSASRSRRSSRGRCGGWRAPQTAVGAGDLTARAPEHEGPPEVRSLAAVFNETVAKLDQLLRSQEEFVADASHQLRTPLTALQPPAREPRARRRARRDARSSTVRVAEVARLGSMVEALLALARADTGREPAGRVDVDLVVRERVGAWSALADERGVWPDHGRRPPRPRPHRGGATAAGARQPARERARGLAARGHDHGRDAVGAVVDRAADQGRGAWPDARRARARVRSFLAEPQRRGQRSRAGDRSPPRRAGRREASSCSRRRATGSRRSSGYAPPE